MTHDDTTRPDAASVQRTPAEPYEPPEIIDYGSLQDLTRSGNMPLSDSFGGAAGGGS